MFCGFSGWKEPAGCILVGYSRIIACRDEKRLCCRWVLPFFLWRMMRQSRSECDYSRMVRCFFHRAGCPVRSDARLDMFPSCEAVGKIMRNFCKECAMFFGLYLLFLPLSVGPYILIPQKSGKGRTFHPVLAACFPANP